ncbi:hypothetical protein J3A83DRAFT_4374512 [Scleroderma citrinum]
MDLAELLNPATKAHTMAEATDEDIYQSVMDTKKAQEGDEDRPGYDTTITVIDIDEDPIPMKKVKSEKVVHHQRQTLISSLVPLVASEAVPTGSHLELKSSHGSSHFTNNDLPTMFLKDRKWLKNVLPTLLLWLGDQPNVIFLKFTDLQDIHPNMPIFSLANNHLSMWHHSVGSIAIAMLDCFFADEPSVIVKKTCSVLLKDHAFVYDGMKSEDHEKAFQSAFVLQLLANAHICVCFGSVDVPVLQLLMETNRVRGAIALCVAVLEHAFILVRSNITLKGTGKGKGFSSQKLSSKPSDTDNTFSEQNWGGKLVLILRQLQIMMITPFWTSSNQHKIKKALQRRLMHANQCRNLPFPSHYVYFYFFFTASFKKLLHTGRSFNLPSSFTLCLSSGWPALQPSLMWLSWANLAADPDCP